MTTTLADLFDLSLFEEMRDGGYIRVQHHPDLPLHIANYAEKAQYEHVWNAATLTCRGLIFDDEGTVKARPYRKFFNYGDEQNTGPLDLGAPVVVTDKLDGSLGISYPTPDGPAIATRGSFTSDQAVHATHLLRRKYPDFRPDPGFTYLWEIVFPANRIVLDYGDLDDLILHGVVSINLGSVWRADWSPEWTGPRAQFMPHPTLADALAAAPRPNAEGMVVRYADSDLMVKIKQEDYVALHRIVTGLNARTIWEWLGAGKTVGDLCATIPDDFHGWVEDLAEELHESALDLTGRANTAHAGIMSALKDTGRDWGRREYASFASTYGELRPYLFLLLDGNESKARDLAWRAVKPSGARSLINHTEAVA